MRKQIISTLPLIIVVTLIAIASLSKRGYKRSESIRIGHTGSTVTASLYALNRSDSIELIRFFSDDDAGYALISGEIDAAILTPEKASLLLKSPAGRAISSAGVYEYPFGATLAIRGDLDIRLADLPGLRVAVSSPTSAELRVFAEELNRFEIDISSIRFVVLPQNTMIPALTTGSIDGALIRGSSIAPIKKEGHQILFQKWDFEPGDDCCNINAQIEKVLLVSKRDPKTADFINTKLLKAEKAGADSLRNIVIDEFPHIKNSTIPMAEYKITGPNLLDRYINHLNHGERVEGVKFDDELRRGRHHNCSDNCTHH